MGERISGHLCESHLMPHRIPLHDKHPSACRCHQLLDPSNRRSSHKHQESQHKRQFRRLLVIHGILASCLQVWELYYQIWICGALERIQPSRRDRQLHV